MLFPSDTRQIYAGWVIDFYSARVCVLVCMCMKGSLTDIALISHPPHTLIYSKLSVCVCVSARAFASVVTSDRCSDPSPASTQTTNWSTCWHAMSSLLRVLFFFFFNPLKPLHNMCLFSLTSFNLSYASNCNASQQTRKPTGPGLNDQESTASFFVFFWARD